MVYRHAVRNLSSLHVAAPTPTRGKTGGRERSLSPVFPHGVGTATRRLEFFLSYLKRLFISSAQIAAFEL